MKGRRMQTRKSRYLQSETEALRPEETAKKLGERCPGDRSKQPCLRLTMREE